MSMPLAAEHCCEQCRLLPDPWPEQGHLLVAPSRENVVGCLHKWCDLHQVHLAELGFGCYSIPVHAKLLKNICTFFSLCLAHDDLFASRASFSPGQQQAPKLDELLTMPSLAEIVERMRGEWLVKVIKQDRLYPVYQPIVSLTDRTAVLGIESLLRAEGEGDDSITAGAIFHQARQMGLESILDCRARCLALQQVAAHRFKGLLFLNIVAENLCRTSTCVEKLCGCVKALGLSHSQIVLEVVEEERNRTAPEIAAAAMACREYGLRFALDDLGAGYSDLNMLLELRPEFIKLDLKLVQRAPFDPLSSSIAKHVVQAIHENGGLVIAEGIEEERTYEWARSIGVDYGQGYLLGRPQRGFDFGLTPILM